MKNREKSLYHTVVYATVKTPGYLDRKIYVLYTFDENTQPTPMQQLIEYFYEFGRTRSLAWQKNGARATGLFIDFLKSNIEIFNTPDSRTKILQAYSEALIGGTITLTGEDPSGLWWEPRSFNRSKELLDSITNFSDWLVKKYKSTKLNPWKDSSIAQQIAYWRRFDQRRSKSILAHISTREMELSKSKQTRSFKINRNPITAATEPAKSFPEEKIFDLIFYGFIKNGKSAENTNRKSNIRDALITTLLHGAGLRESEPFHIYVSDIGIDPKNPKSAIVRIYHPEQGKAPPDHINPLTKKYMNEDREQYLKTRYQSQPRNLIDGRFHAGWKNLQLSNGTEKYTQVNWFPSYWGEIFLTLFKIYISRIRPTISNHPYLFVSLNRENFGAPYTIDSYRQSHARAIKRIGLTPQKQYGTTPHGHRHAYGQMLTDAGVPEIVIQRALNHKSIISQNVYTSPSQSKIDEELRKAQSRIDTTAALNKSRILVDL
ncbi:MAG: site-specific integrase [Dechloromonas sp.]|uniref:gamma-mobile-trio recombinase GmtY n=1 Tax=Dechloromonas sp. TaxID=1917218 RepID=UPI0027E720C5|nr:gamma-mobile-trio recombinase GmtY [Dechloromonas sp.]MBT9521300.1 site-specific integrase [Dechloromonas sp.]